MAHMGVSWGLGWCPRPCVSPVTNILPTQLRWSHPTTHSGLRTCPSQQKGPPEAHAPSPAPSGLGRFLSLSWVFVALTLGQGQGVPALGLFRLLGLQQLDAAFSRRPVSQVTPASVCSISGQAGFTHSVKAVFAGHAHCAAALSPLWVTLVLETLLCENGNI